MKSGMISMGHETTDGPYIVCNDTNKQYSAHSQTD
eukprot:SAG25_NODE_14099_length_259_cov_0.643750_1_plen_34_part_10